MKDIKVAYVTPYKTEFQCKICGQIYVSTKVDKVSLLDISKLENKCCIPDNLVKVYYDRS